jgi:hypothetical protein
VWYENQNENKQRSRGLVAAADVWAGEILKSHPHIKLTVLIDDGAQF